LKTVEFTQSLVASEPTGSNVTYSIDTGSTLPGGVILYSNGTLTGNIIEDPGNTSTYNFTIQATDFEYQNIPRTFSMGGIKTVSTGENFVYTDIYSMVQSLGATGSTDLPVTGGTLHLNSQALASYDYVCKKSSVSLSSFTASDWFTTTADIRSAWIKVYGDLTIQSGVTFSPPVRKLFTVIHVTGNLTVNGTISMTARGANHSGITATSIAIISGTYSGIVNPYIPSSGGAGATAVSSTSGNLSGNAGINYPTFRSDGGTGGGGGGGVRNNGYPGTTVMGGAGAAGTGFSGGPGGGGAWGGNDVGTSATGGSGAASGGAGGTGAAAGSGSQSAHGGAGNPGGGGSGPNGVAGQNGTGGILIIIVEGSFMGTGSITANGSDGGTYTGSLLLGTSGAGGSGGGSITILSRTDTSSTTITAAGGAGSAGTGDCSSGTCPGGNGGNGGNGTARKLTL
jgi:hypothetical protein